MIKITVTILMLFSSTLLFGQSRSIIKGKVIESLEITPLTKATVAVINTDDSTLIAYTLSNQNGEFLLYNFSKYTHLRVIISHISFFDFKKDINLSKGETFDLGSVKMEKKTVSLSEIVIKSDIVPVTLNKDTIEFASGAFKVRPNAVVEDLLNKLPGLQVNNDGSILVNGKSVDKILLNGHEYFSNDLRIASKNLDASMISKVQIYDDRSDDPDNIIHDSKIGKIINLKTKSIYKKSFFGKAYAGVGTNKRYETGSLLNLLNDTLQVSLIGYSNNLSRTAFSKDDLSSFGGFKRGGLDQINSGSILTGGKISDGIEKLLSSGLNINNDYGQKLKINFLAFISNSSVNYLNSSLNENFLGDTILYQRQNNDKTQTQVLYNVSSLLQFKPSLNEQIKYSPHFSFNNSNSNSKILGYQTNSLNDYLNTQSDISKLYNKSNHFDHTLTYYKKLKGENSITINHKFFVNNSSTNNILYNNLTSYINSIVSDTLQQLNNLRVQSISVSTEAIFRYKYRKNWLAVVSYNNSFNNDNQDILTFGYNNLNKTYSTALFDQSNGITRKDYIQNLKPGVTAKLSNSTSITIELNNQLQYINSFDNSQRIQRQYFNVLPSLNIQGTGYTFSYTQLISLPSISDLNPALIKINSLYSFFGNPYLTPSKSHNLMFNYFFYNNQQQTSFFIYAQSSVKQNTVYNHILFSPQDIQLANPANGGNSYNTFLAANFTKQFSKFTNSTISIKASINPGFSKNIVSINNLVGNLNNYYSTASLEFRFRYKDIFELTPFYELSPTRSTYTGITLNAFNNVNQKLTLKNFTQLNKSFFVEGDYSYLDNAQLNVNFKQSINLLNFSLVYQTPKFNRSQIKLTAFDLLNQNKSTYRTISSNGIYQGESLIQKRYFLLSYQLKFLKSNLAKTQP